MRARKREWAGAEQALAALENNPFFSDSPIRLDRDLGEGLLARCQRDKARAQRASDFSLALNRM